MNAVPVAINWHAGMSIFASEPFLATLGKEYGWIGGVDEHRPTRCILPYAVVRAGGFRLVRFPVETIVLGDRWSVDDERCFLQSATEHFCLMRYDVIIPATFNAIFMTYPHGAVAAPYSSHVIDLQRSEPALWGAIHPKHRNVIRSATKRGVTIRSGTEHMETAYALTRASFLRSSRSIVQRARVMSRLRYAVFRRQVESFGQNVKVFVAEYEGVAQSAAVLPYSNYSAYYMHGGTLESPITGASNLLQWEAIRSFRELGVSRYDFFGARIAPPQGSKAEGLTMFKERFGGVPKRGYMWKYPLRPLRTRLYTAAALLRSGGDVVDQERRRLAHSGA